MTALVDEHQEHKSKGKPPTPPQRIHPNREKHRSPRLQQNWQNLQDWQDEQLQLGKKFKNQEAHCPQRDQRLFDLLPYAWPRLPKAGRQCGRVAIRICIHVNTDRGFSGEVKWISARVATAVDKVVWDAVQFCPKAATISKDRVGFGLPARSR